jgi:hypothetical protein
MRCRQCDGSMVVDSFIDMEDDGGPLWLRAWCCVKCEEVAEPGLPQHRVARRLRFSRVLAGLSRRSAADHEIVPLGI